MQPGLPAPSGSASNYGEIWGVESARVLHPRGGKAGFGSWDVEDLLVLIRMWQAGDVGAVGGQGDFLKALEGVETRMLIMPSRADQYFPPEDSETEVKHLSNGVFTPIPTVWGTLLEAL